jgi:hypothetical protein
MTSKKFKLQSEEIKPVVESPGWCMATDRIMVDGCQIRYMYREKPMAAGDSGWRFFAGDEDDNYMKNDDNHGVYDLNTVANYDQTIIPYINSAPGSRFDRISETVYKLLP